MIEAVAGANVVPPENEEIASSFPESPSGQAVPLSYR